MPVHAYVILQGNKSPMSALAYVRLLRARHLHARLLKFFESLLLVFICDIDTIPGLVPNEMG